MQHVFARVHAVPMTTPHNAAMYAALLGNKHIKCDVVMLFGLAGSFRQAGYLTTD